MAKKKTREWPELEAIFTQLQSAVTRKTYTKARKLAATIDYNLLIAGLDGELSVADTATYRARLRSMITTIPPAPPRKKTVRQLRREAHERWLYKNNEYQG